MPLPSQPKLVLILLTPEGWKAELTWLAGYIHRWYNASLELLAMTSRLAELGDFCSCQLLRQSKHAKYLFACNSRISFTIS